MKEIRRLDRSMISSPVERRCLFLADDCVGEAWVYIGFAFIILASSLVNEEVLNFVEFF